MATSTLLWSVILCVVLVGSISEAQKPCINIGRTISKTGDGQLGSLESQQGLDFFMSWVNNVRGGVRWNGTDYVYCLKLITLNDASDVTNVIPLYNYMLDHQNVTVVVPPYGTAVSFVNTSLVEFARLMIPTTIATSAQLYGLYPNAVGTLVPNRAIQVPCANALYKSGARYAQIIYDPAQGTTAKNGFIGLTGANITVQANITVNTTGGVTWQTFSPYVQQWKTQNPPPDVLFIAMTPPNTKLVIEAIRRDGWQPKAIMTNHGGFLQQLTSNTTAPAWMVEGVIAGDSWHASVINADPFFNDTIGFNTAFEKFANHPPTTLQGAAFAAGLVLMYAFDTATTLSSSDIISAMYAVDQPSFWGPLKFKADGSLAFNGICLQIKNNQLQVVGSSIATEQTFNLTYPLHIKTPAHFFDTGYHTRQTVKWVLVGVIPAVFVIVALTVVVICVMTHRYHLIFIPKQEEGAEWNE